MARFTMPLHPYAIKVPGRSGPSATGSQLTHVTTPNPATNPKAAAPLQPAVIQKGQQPNFTEGFTLSSSVIQGNAYNTPTSQDIIGLQCLISGSVTTPSAAWDVSSIVERIEIYNRAGKLVMNIQGGTFLYDLYTRFAAVKPAAVRSNSVTATATTFSATIQVIGLRLPAKNGPYAVNFYYNTLAATKSSAASIAFTNAVSAIFGSANGITTRMRNQTFTLAAGDNYLQTLSVPQGVPIYEVFMRGWSAIGNLSYVQIESGSGVVEQNLKESAIVQRMTDLDLDSYETTTLVLREPGPFIMDSNGTFDLNLGTADSPTITWYWVE